MEQPLRKSISTGDLELNVKNNVKDSSKGNRKSLSNTEKSSPAGKKICPAVKLKDVTVKMVRAGISVLPGKGLVISSEKKRKTILNSMRKSPVKKAIEEKSDCKGKDVKSGDSPDKLTPKKRVKKTIKTDSVSPKIPDIVVTPSEENVGKTKKQRSPKKKKESVIEGKGNEQTNKTTPRSRQKIQQAALETTKGKSRTPSKSPSPSRKKRNASPDKPTSGLTAPELSPEIVEKSGKRSRSPNAKFKEDIIMYPWNSEKKSPKRSPKPKYSPKSGSSSKTSSSSKRFSESDDSFTSTTSSSVTSSNDTTPEKDVSSKNKALTSSNDTSPEKDVSPKNKSSAIKNLFPADESDAQEDTNFEQPVFEGLENCSITVDDEKLGMFKNFKYKYTGESVSKSALSDLIAKVNSNIETPDHDRNKILGIAESTDIADDMCSPGGERDINDSLDSDKTLTEFDGTVTTGSLVLPQKGSDENSEKEDKVSKIDDNDIMEDDSTVCVSVKNDNHKDTLEKEVTKERLKISNTEASNEIKSNKVGPILIDKDCAEKVDLNEQEKLESPKKEVSIFEHFGLKLRKKSVTNEEENNDETKREKDRSETSKQDSSTLNESDDVICLDKNVNDVVVISDEDSVTNSPVKKKKYLSVNHIVEPKPIQILTNVEKQVKDKRVAFLSEELEEYIDVNKENMGPLYRNDDEKGETCSSTITSPMSNENHCSPDIDDVNGFVFVSFLSEDVLKVHVDLEKKVEWLNEETLKKLAQLKEIKERQIDAGKTRITDVKSADEQKQNFRGLHMKFTKYQKLLKQECDSFMDSLHTPEKQSLLSPEKTSDITKIKGWKSKFTTDEDNDEVACTNQMKTGKLLKSDERILRNMKAECLKEIEQRKKRKKKDADFDYQVDDDAITEKDVFNEDEYKPPPDKIPYSEKYLSQFKYGARKLFVKKMRLDAADEMILKKLGTQKLTEKETPKALKGRQLVIGRITQMLAVAAVSAIDVKLTNKAKKMDETPRKTRSRRALKDELDGIDDASEPMFDQESEYIPEEFMPEGGMDEGLVQVKTEHKENDRLTGINNRERRDKERKKSFDKCNQPGCRYGCICHLCKLSDSGEEKESENKPPCDKEYCKLGCICESIDTKQIKESLSHCRKPACMFECKCPPKQPKPDIPKVRGRKKKKANRGMKKGPEKQEMNEEYDVKEEMEEPENYDKEDDWEPPSKKKKRLGSGNRFANLPKRESTYRLAKNLDAVSRKAMSVYESSEMYIEQKIRRRRSDPIGDYAIDDSFGDMAGTSFHPVGGTRKKVIHHKVADGPKLPLQKLNPETGVFEISDDSDIEEGPGTCARSVHVCWGLYTAKDRQRRKLELRWLFFPLPVNLLTSAGDSLSQHSKNVVINLADTDDEEKINEKGDRSKKAVSQMTVSQRLGRFTKESLAEASKWKTQMVCLKAKKKSDDKKSDPQSEIKLLEIISNCSWENDRTNMLSKISQIISKDYSANYVTMWQSYVLQFLPKADKPAVIPPELQSKLPNSMYSIRVRVTQNITDIEKAENDAKEDADKEESDDRMKNMTEEERKKYCIKQQSKLIEKIKFAERLRDLIKNEELKGISPSKFSVSLEGIEKALKRYKTQLWKAYTGSSNKSLMQIKQAVQALKNPGNGNNTNTKLTPLSKQGGNKNANIMMPNGCGVSSGTLSRLQTNQGLKIQNSMSLPSGGQAFISLGSFKPNDGVSGSNITIKNQDIMKKQASSMSSKLLHSALPMTAAPPVLTMQAPQGVKAQASPGMNPPQANEVLLIPIQDPNGGKWDPSSNPVFTAQVTMIPTVGANTSLSNSVVNLTAVPSPGLVPHHGPVRMVMPPGCPTSTKITRPMLNPALTAYANAPYLPNQIRNQSPVGANSQLLFSSIQPISSGSAVFSQVQSMMTQCMPFNSVPAAQIKTIPPVAVCRPKVPNSTAPLCTAVPINTSVAIKDIPQANSGKSGNLNAFPPIRYASPFANASSGTVNFITNTNANAKQMILVPVSSTGGAPSVSPGAAPLQTMIAVTVSNIVSSLPPSTSKPVRMVSPHTVGRVAQDGTDPKTTPSNSLVQISTPNVVVQPLSSSGVQLQEIAQNGDLCVNKYTRSLLYETKQSVNGANSDTEKCDKADQVIESNKDNSSAGVAAVDDGETETSDVNVVNFVDSSKLIVNTNVHDLNRMNSQKLEVKHEKDIIDLVGSSASEKELDKLMDIEKNIVKVDQDAANRKRKCVDLVDDNACKVSKRKGAFNSQDKSAINNDSEDSDVDIVSLDVPKLQQPSRRKSQQVSMSMDDFEIKSVKVKNKGSDIVNLANTRIVMERTRRHIIKHCRNTLSKVVFKYNPDIRNFSTAIPQHLLMTEGTNLIRALKHKAARLQESIADGQQYQQSLKEKLKIQIGDFVQSGVPEPIIRNFVKSVSKAMLSTFPKKKKGTAETSTLEDSDTDLDYDRLSTEDVMKNKNTSLEKVLDAFGEDDFEKGESDLPSPETVTDNTLLSKLESLDSGIYIDHAEREVIDVFSDNDSVQSGEVDCGSDVEIRSSTGDVMLEGDLIDLDEEGACSTAPDLGENGSENMELAT